MAKRRNNSPELYNNYTKKDLTNIYKKPFNEKELKNIIKDDTEKTRTGNIKNPRAEANKFEKYLPTKETIAFFKNIKKENTPAEFREALKIQQERGNPAINVGTNKGLPFHNRRNYNPFTNEINIPKPWEYSSNLENFLKEAGHAGQPITEVVPRFLKNDIPGYIKAYTSKGNINDNIEKYVYNNPNTVENYTHSKIQPELENRVYSSYSLPRSKEEEADFIEYTRQSINSFNNNKKADGGQLNNELNPKYNNYLNNNMRQYAQGGDLTRFDAGGTHEQNPNGGVPQGFAPDGSQNVVEQGESKKGNFIYSNRIELNKDLIKQFNLPGYVIGKSVSDASKAIDDKFKDRADRYAQETKKTLLDRLADAQEYLKQQKQASIDQTNESMQANSQEIPDQMNGEIPEGMEEYVQNEGAGQEEMQAQQMQTEEAQQPMPSSPIAAFGGYQQKRFYPGGGPFSSMNTLDPDAGIGYKFEAKPMTSNSVLTKPSVLAGTKTPAAGATPDAAAATGPSAASIVGAASTALDLGKTAFGKAKQNTDGLAASEKVDSVGIIGGSALKGASAGTAIAPGIGTAIGAGVGLIAGVLGNAKEKKAAIANTNKFAINTNNKFSDNYLAYGGMLGITKMANGGLYSTVDPGPKAVKMTRDNLRNLNVSPGTNTSQPLGRYTNIVGFQPGVTEGKTGKTGAYVFSPEVSGGREFVNDSGLQDLMNSSAYSKYKEKINSQVASEKAAGKPISSYSHLSNPTTAYSTYAKGGSMENGDPGDPIPATRQDSIKVRDDSLRMLNEYKKRGYKPTKISFPEDNNDKALSIMQSRQKNNDITQVIRNGVRSAENYNAADYRQNIDQNTYRQREAANGVLNMDITPALYDKRITPPSYLRLMGKEGDTYNDGVSVPYYGDMKVSPKETIPTTTPKVIPSNTNSSNEIIQRLTPQTPNTQTRVPQITTTRNTPVTQTRTPVASVRNNQQVPVTRNNSYVETNRPVVRDNTRVGTSFNTIDPRILRLANSFNPSMIKHSYGGNMNVYDGGGKMKRVPEEKIEPIIAKRIEPKGVNDNLNLNNELLKKTVDSKLSTKDNLKLKYIDAKNYYKENIKSNIGDAMRLAPVAMNAYQLKNLKKPQGFEYQTLTNRYKPQYVDEAQMQRIVDQEGNNTMSAIGQMGGSEGATRNAILAMGLNKTKALSDAYANAAAQNRAQDAQAQQFNLGVDSQNISIRNKAIDEMRADAGAYDTAKSKYLSAIGTDIGDIGKERNASDAGDAMFGYTRKGKYLYNKDGSKVSDAQLAKDRARYAAYITEQNKKSK